MESTFHIGKASAGAVVATDSVSATPIATTESLSFMVCLDTDDTTILRLIA